MWMEFAGVAGMSEACCWWWCRGGAARGEALGAGEVPDLMELGRAGEEDGWGASSARRRVVVGAWAVGHGGGYGDVETEVMVAVWARYDLSGWKDGIVRTFCCVH